jgi:hypothetical protein
LNWLRNFMVGRNGVDQLSVAVIILALLLNFLSRNIGSSIPTVFAVILLAWAVFRMLSGNIEKRRSENLRFVRMLSGIKNGYAGFRYDRAQARAYKFFTCPGCRNRLRVPRGKGKLNITCPKCGQRFSGKT